MSQLLTSLIEIKLHNPFRITRSSIEELFRNQNGTVSKNVERKNDGFSNSRFYFNILRLEWNTT